MTTALTKALTTHRASMALVRDQTARLKAAGMLGTQLTPFSNSYGPWQEHARSRTQYSLFRGWLYAAVNAIASDAAGQPVKLGRMVNRKTGTPRKTKHWELSRMTDGLRTKAARQELEILEDHPLIDSLEEPNPIQGRWQFVYSFVANLCLTGWSYVVGGERPGGGWEFYSLPTTWFKPDHVSKGPFGRFRIVNPLKPESSQDQNKWFDRSQVAFAHLPDPSDPMSAMAPSGAQLASIRIDDHIQTSQEMFFENGIFPSVIVTVGRDPHPDVPAGVRPRLTSVQRRQVYGVIRKVMGGVANYGNPAIVDGLIEKIEKLSMTQTEMGWDRSEDKVRTRILSAYGVHPYILGEPVGVGGYAQVANIEKRFYKRVNTYLDMLSMVMSNFISQSERGTLIWWERCEPHDPQLHWVNIRAARANDDITQNELRSMLGLPPDEDLQESVISKGLSQHLLKMFELLSGGAMTPQQAQATMEGWGLPAPLAKKLSKPPEKKEPPPQLAPGGQPGGLPAPGGKPGAEQGKPITVEEASKELRAAVASLRVTPEEIAGYLTHEAEA